jgi:hypothetical protein
MTSQSPRIYLYKITFEEVQYYYYGVHKEKKCDEYYMGSPVTHSWVWDFYTPKKQILELFEFSDKGWIEAQEVEKRIIKPFYNNDKWCLNEHCGGKISLTILRNGGRISGKRCKEEKLGIFGMTQEQTDIIRKKAHNTQKQMGIGLYGNNKEFKIKNGQKAGRDNVILKRGCFSIDKDERTLISKDAVKKTNSQRWECCETGYISTSAGVVAYQRGKGIDTSKNNRKQIS